MVLSLPETTDEQVLAKRARVPALPPRAAEEHAAVVREPQPPQPGPCGCTCSTPTSPLTRIQARAPHTLSPPFCICSQVAQFQAEFQSAFSGASQEELESAKCRCAPLPSGGPAGTGQGVAAGMVLGGFGLGTRRRGTCQTAWQTKRRRLRA
jgi:hypothetical protein